MKLNDYHGALWQSKDNPCLVASLDMLVVVWCSDYPEYLNRKRLAETDRWDKYGVSFMGWVSRNWDKLER